MALFILILFLLVGVVVAVIALALWSDYQNTQKLEQGIQRALLDRGLQGEVVDRQDRVSTFSRSGTVQLVVIWQDGQRVHCEFLVVDNEPKWMDQKVLEVQDPHAQMG